MRLAVFADGRAPGTETNRRDRADAGDVRLVGGEHVQTPAGQLRSRTNSSVAHHQRPEPHRQSGRRCCAGELGPLVVIPLDLHRGADSLLVGHHPSDIVDRDRLFPIERRAGGMGPGRV